MLARCCSNWCLDDQYYRGWAIGSGYGMWLVHPHDGGLARICMHCWKFKKLGILVRELERYPGDDQYIFRAVLSSDNGINYIKVYNIEDQNNFNFSFCCGPAPMEIMQALKTGIEKLLCDDSTPVLAL